MHLDCFCCTAGGIIFCCDVAVAAVFFAAGLRSSSDNDDDDEVAVLEYIFSPLSSLSLSSMTYTCGPGFGSTIFFWPPLSLTDRRPTDPMEMESRRLVRRSTLGNIFTLMP